MSNNKHFVDIDGTEHWYRNNELHRVGGPAVIFPSGTKEWWVNGRLHREDGPAIVEAQGNKTWCRNGRIHREDGPAIEYADGSKEWWLYGDQVDPVEHFIQVQEMLYEK